MWRPIHALLTLGIGVLLAAASLVAVARAGESQVVAVVESGRALDDEVALLEGFVERARGRRFRTTVDVVALGERAFLRRANELDAEGRVAERVAGLVLQAIGLLERGRSLTESYDAIIDEGVAGFYDARTDELVVRGEGVTPFLRRVLVHELTHALEDQHFDLDRPDLGDEAALAFAALAEGSAIHVEAEWVDQLTAKDRAASEPATRPRDAAVPEAVDALFGFPYDFGPALVRAIRSDGGQRALDAAFTDVAPASSEDVLHPERWLAGDRPVAVPVPAADGTVLDEGEIGAFTLQHMLDVELSAAESIASSDRWGGDAYVAWTDGAATCVRATFVMDTPAAQARLEGALARWSAARDARGNRASADGGSLTTCA